MCRIERDVVDTTFNAWKLYRPFKLERRRRILRAGLTNAHAEKNNRQRRQRTKRLSQRQGALPQVLAESASRTPSLRANIIARVPS